MIFRYVRSSSRLALRAAFASEVRCDMFVCLCLFVVVGADKESNLSSRTAGIEKIGDLEESRRGPVL